MSFPRPLAEPAPIADAARLGTVLGIWAHPDDEAFLSAGLMAAARDAGNRVVCVTATLGERGTDDPTRWPPHRLSAVRGTSCGPRLPRSTSPSTTCSASPTALSRPSPQTSSHAASPASSPPLSQTPSSPSGLDGMTGHEDHQAVSAWSTAAHAAAAPDKRLLYATTTEEFVQAWEPCREQFDIFLTGGLPLRTRASELAVSLRLGPAAVDRKIVALRAQASQTTKLFAALGEEQVRQWWSTETFVAADAARDRTQERGTYERGAA